MRYSATKRARLSSAGRWGLNVGRAGGRRLLTIRASVRWWWLGVERVGLGFAARSDLAAAVVVVLADVAMVGGALIAVALIAAADAALGVAELAVSGGRGAGLVAALER